MRNCWMACKNESNCVSLFVQRMIQLDNFLMLARLEVVQLRTRVCSTCVEAVMSRPCVGSNMPLLMCDRELWDRWRALGNVTQADIDFQLAAFEPTNSSGAMFLRMQTAFAHDKKCFVGYCSRLGSNITRLELLAEFLSNRTAADWSDVSVTMTRDNFLELQEAWQRSWVSSGMLYALFRVGKTSLARRAYAKVAMLRELQLLSPTESGVALLQAEIDRQWNDWQLWRYNLRETEVSRFFSATDPADKLDGALGLGFSCLALLFALALLVFLVVKARSSEMALVVVIGVFACVWSAFRIAFWV